MAAAVDDRTALYRSKIIKAGALLDDTRTLFSFWDVRETPRANLERIRSENLLGKASRSRLEDVLAIFRQRYLGDCATANALAILVQARLPAPTLTPLFYFHAAQSDRLLHDTVTELIAPMQWQGHPEVSNAQVIRFLLDQVHEGRTAGIWSEATAARIAQGLLATLRDFGVLSGATRKHVTPMYLPADAFAYIAFQLQRREHSGDRVLNSPEWSLFFLQPGVVERLFVDADMHGLLRFNAAGSVVRIDFPVGSLEEYAHALAERAHRAA